MERNIFSISLVVVILSGFLFVSCEDDETKTIYNTDIPSLTVSALTVSSAGGQYNMTYTVANAVDGGVVYASDDVTWITNVTIGTGAVSITVAENTSEAARSGNVTIEYVYTDNGGSKVVTERAGVIQTGSSDPVIIIQPNVVVATYNGGSYSFDYSIKNVADDGWISCSTETSWISGLDDMNYGTISFEVEPNEDEDLRSGIVTVAYTYATTTITVDVSVVQDHRGSFDSGDDDRNGPTEMIGTYTAHGSVYNSTTSSATAMDWEAKIYYYDGYSTEYDYWLDGISPYVAGMYATYGDHRASAGIYMASDGTLHVPSQVFQCIVDPYYLGFTPCLGKSGNNYDIDSNNWPDLVFTYNESTGQWVSDYGSFLGAFNSRGLGSFVGYYLEVVEPTYTLTKVSDSTSVSTGIGTESTLSWTMSDIETY